MLSRTAENLYWMARYIERAETNARLLEVGARNALIPNIGGGYRNEWESILHASGNANGFAEKYSDIVQRNIETFMFFDRDNANSVLSCIERARENGRIVRTALTTQVWDAINIAYQEVQEFGRQERSSLSLSDLTDWTLRTTALIRGAGLNTQMRNDGWDFTNIGFHLERADSTARMLDVKYFTLLPQISYVGSGLDNYQWRTLLRAMSSSRAFNWAYGGEISPAKIVDFLVLNRACPRSLISSVESANEHLDRLARAYGKSGPAQTRARALVGELHEMQVQDVFDEGLHEFLTRFMGQVMAVGGAAQTMYLSGDIR
ncbi:alpha-E domain-containing protein [Oceaniglobus ichthyenteri]|uniref:alpha-E domain-containing protein n=1 Tax=Oceaniglobus ichthyenteri TaxID=2136177 RepID=UPI000D39C2DE|nr:alpha-E domain-containing protein [Oceaniglobus ichthyenteri]